MIRKVLITAGTLFILAICLITYWIYINWQAAMRPPEFIILNNSNSVVSIKAAWRDSELSLTNMRAGGSFTFSMREEGGMTLVILREGKEKEVKELGYFTSGSRYQLNIGETYTESLP